MRAVTMRSIGVCLEDSRVEIENNITKHDIRQLKISRKNWQFVGSGNDGARIVNILSIIDTAKLHGHNPQAYLADFLTRIRDHLADQ